MKLNRKKFAFISLLLFALLGSPCMGREAGGFSLGDTNGQILVPGYLQSRLSLVRSTDRTSDSTTDRVLAQSQTTDTSSGETRTEARPGPDRIRVEGMLSFPNTPHLNGGKSVIGGVLEVRAWGSLGNGETDEPGRFEVSLVDGTVTAVIAAMPGASLKGFCSATCTFVPAFPQSSAFAVYNGKEAVLSYTCLEYMLGGRARSRAFLSLRNCGTMMGLREIREKTYFHELRLFDDSPSEFLAGLEFKADIEGVSGVDLTNVLLFTDLRGTYAKISAPLDLLGLRQAMETGSGYVTLPAGELEVVLAHPSGGRGVLVASLADVDELPFPFWQPPVLRLKRPKVRVWNEGDLPRVRVASEGLLFPGWIPETLRGLLANQKTEASWMAYDRLCEGATIAFSLPGAVSDLQLGAFLLKQPLLCMNVPPLTLSAQTWSGNEQNISNDDEARREDDIARTLSRTKLIASASAQYPKWLYAALGGTGSAHHAVNVSLSKSEKSGTLFSATAIKLDLLQGEDAFELRLVAASGGNAVAEISLDRTILENLPRIGDRPASAFLGEGAAVVKNAFNIGLFSLEAGKTVKVRLFVRSDGVAELKLSGQSADNENMSLYLTRSDDGKFRLRK